MDDISKFLSPVQLFINTHIDYISTVNVADYVITIKFRDNASIDNLVEKLDKLKPSVKSIENFKDDDGIFNVQIALAKS